MWTQRDQLQAYQFLRRRLVSALQMGDANHPISPSRRIIACGAIGAIVMLLISAGFGIYGLLRPGANTDWRKPGQVVIDKDTGTHYVLMKDQLLHPVLNYTSARLLAGGNGTATARVSSKSLRNAPRGRPVGIPGAPQSLPTPDALVTQPWTVCSETSRERRAVDAAATVVTVGVTQFGTRLSSRHAFVVRQGTTSYVVADGRRMRADNAVLQALGLKTDAVVRATEAWISAVPAGPDLKLITVPNAGKQARRIGGVVRRVGQVLKVAHISGSIRYYVVLADGVAPVGPTEAALVLGNGKNLPPNSDQSPRVVEVTAADIDAVGQSRTQLARPDYPQDVLQPVDLDGNRAICATAADGGKATIHVAATVPLPARAARIPLTGKDPRVADEAYVPPGRGAVVKERRPSGALVGPTYLVTDQGIRFPIPNADAVKALGFGGVQPAPVPAEMLALFPVGPTLDQQSAARYVTTEPEPDGSDTDKTPSRD